MKRFLAVLLVFGLASVASAALQISVNGDLDPEDSTIFLTPSETVTLDIWSTVPIAPGGEGEGQFVLVAQAPYATVSGGFPVVGDFDWLLDILEDPVRIATTIGIVPNPSGVFGYIYTFGKTIPADTAIFDGIVLHFESDNGPTDIILYELDGASGSYVVGVWDVVVVHQIPEPASIFLLGLGSILLRKKRRADS